jgi:hypothetical protein
MFCFREKQMASSRLFNNLGKSFEELDFDQRIEFLGRFGLGIAIAGGVINSMLYNGNE